MPSELIKNCGAPLQHLPAYNFHNDVPINDPFFRLSTILVTHSINRNYLSLFLPSTNRIENDESSITLNKKVEKRWRQKKKLI